MGDVLLAAGYVLGLVLAAGVILWARDRLTGPREPTGAELAARERTYRARLLGPNWSVVETTLGGGSVSDALRDLYQDRDLLLSTNLDVVDPRLNGGEAAVWSIDRFCPADREALAEQWEELPPGSFVFAECDGDPYYVVLKSAGRSNTSTMTALTRSPWHPHSPYFFPVAVMPAGERPIRAPDAAAFF